MDGIILLLSFTLKIFHETLHTNVYFLFELTKIMNDWLYDNQWKYKKSSTFKTHFIFICEIFDIQKFDKLFITEFKKSNKDE